MLLDQAVCTSVWRSTEQAARPVLNIAVKKRQIVKIAVKKELATLSYVTDKKHERGQHV
jgi:hypothetical protein